MQCNNKSPLLLQEYSNAGQDMERFRASLRAMMYPYSSYTSLLWKISHICQFVSVKQPVSFVQISQMLCIVNCSFLWNSYTQFLRHICICFQMYLSVPLQWNGMGYIRTCTPTHHYITIVNNRFLNSFVLHYMILIVCFCLDLACITLHHHFYFQHVSMKHELHILYSTITGILYKPFINCCKKKFTF